jgi:protoporphyrin/coproporphyrin ferrochelatase
MSPLPDGVGVALLNMGGPADLDAVEPFLRELFSDPAILGAPWPVRPLLASWIARRRAPHSRIRYARHGDASPLLAATAEQARALEAQLGCPVVVAMRYGRPTSDEALEELATRGISRVIALPLYPQYSTTTSATSLAALRDAVGQRELEIAEVASYPELPGLVDALARAAAARLEQAGDAPGIHLLFAAHGIPLSRVRGGDPYPEQVNATARAVAERLDVPWSLGFQSRVGPVRWLEPSVDEEVDRLAGEGIGVLVVQPLTFVSENLETLDDLDRELADRAAERGIGRFLRGAAPGTDPAFIEGLADTAVQRAAASGWLVGG